MLEVAADNLANLQTPGFQQSQVVLATRPATGLSGLQVGTGVQVAAITRDTSQGALVPAANPLQLAVEGDGYLVLEGSQGERLYTRDGTFHLNADGELVTSAGQRVLGWRSEQGLFQGELVPLFMLPTHTQHGSATRATESLTTRLQIGTDGRLQLRLPDGSTQTIGQLRIAQFTNPAGLRAIGRNTFAVTAASGPPHMGNPGRDGWGTIRAQATEASNSDVGANLINMSRAEFLFRANLHVLDVADQLWQELLEMRRS